ncbi:axial regulator YABBY 5 [Senna tora]|uniref:Axial regulator YABBY 5 n=1 Tax=Senna tora TaxID=362788 RepID=A0A834SPD0_9FABA|nr:axial regulator YABBY 5 [Senna tora]
MSSCSSMEVGAEQLCYIPCNFCNIVLAVSVPCSSLFDIVTVRCGHCSNLWEEIQRIKANNPDISHREAFSTAAKNWAHFPHIHFGLMLETNNQAKMDNGGEKHLKSRAALLNK